MIKKLNKFLTIHYNGNFPFSCRWKFKNKHTIILSIGGNIGDTKKIFNKFCLMLHSNSKFNIIKTSPLLKNPPFGYLEQDYFFNGIITAKTNLSPIALLNELQWYEKRFKRIRNIRNGPRTLDIDIIFYDNIKFKNKRLVIPHKSWKKRDSVTMLL